MNKEGVIKFQADLSCKSLSLSQWDIQPLQSWRSILKRLGWLGQDKKGIGYGNISMRLSDNTYLITGTQTGNIDILTLEHYVRIQKIDIETNKVWAEGLLLPSSECMTHVAVYEVSKSTNFVFHIHDSYMWKHHHNIAITNPLITYGTPAMFKEVKRVIHSPEYLKKKYKGIMILGGHEDGILAWGDTAGEVGNNLLNLLDKTANLS